MNITLDIAAALSAVIWPVIVLIILLAFRSSIPALVEGLAKGYPWLEQAYADAYAAITSQRNAVIVSAGGRLGYPYAPADLGAGIDLLKDFLERASSRFQHQCRHRNRGSGSLSTRPRILTSMRAG